MYLGLRLRSYSLRVQPSIVVAAVLAALMAPAALAQSQYSSSAQYHQQIETLIQDQQYPNQGGYSRQGYHRTVDNSLASHIAFEGGFGFNAPVGNTKKWQTVGYSVTLGGGWMFNPHIGVLAEWNFNNDSIPTSTLQAVGEPDGNVHVWSLTLDPIYYFKTEGHLGGYVTGGGGFYRKLTSFTEPVFVGYYCDYFYGCYPQYSNVTLSHFSSNQGGVNIGAGVTYKLNPDGRAKIFAEARYIWVNSPTTSASGNNVGTGTVGMIPVTFGLRW